MTLKATGAEAVVQILKEEGIKYVFGINGGHVWNFMLAMCEQGIRIIHMRHEQAAAYAADGWARATRQPGVCFGTAGPGFYNMVPGIAHAHLVQSPIVAIFGRHRTYEQEWGPFQEGYAAEVCKSFTKKAIVIEDETNAAYILRKSFRDAMTYPPGPVVVEFPTNLFGVSGPAAERKDQRGYLVKERIASPSHSYGDPSQVEEAVRMLVNAKKPAIIAGNGIFWSDASNELQEFARLLQIPVHTRRMGRGAVSEKDPLTFTGGYRRKIFKEADVIATFGHRLNVLEGFGLNYPQQVEYIQVSESGEDISLVLPTKVAILGNPKRVLRQMIECAKALVTRPSERADWLQFIKEAAEEQRAKNREKAEAGKNQKPIHPDYLGQEIADCLDENTTIIYDSFTLGYYVTDRIEARFAGQVMDAGTCGGVGHGVGMGIGVQLAKPNKKVLVMLGDGGTGVAGFDIETAARYRLPVVYLIFNNSGWTSPNAQKIIFPTMDSWGMLPEIRYDKIFAENSCYTELVTDPSQISPALKRAFASGKTSVLNVIPDIDVNPPLFADRVKVYRPEPKQG
jgi:acetolactate synthase I/II/III large subunit